MLRPRALLPALAGISGRSLTVTAFRAVPLKPFVNQHSDYGAIWTVGVRGQF